MFRITPYVISARYMLYRRQPTDIQLAAISHSSPNFKYKDSCEREPCKPTPPPPPPPRKANKLLWGAITLLVMTGGFVVYAKTQPELRDWLYINATWMDDLIAIAYQENMTYKEFITMCIKDLKKKDTKPKQCSLDGTPVPDKPVDSTTIEKEVNEDKGENAECEKLPPRVVTMTIGEVEACLKDVGESALNNYMTARDACIYYNKLVEETMMTFSMSGMKNLHEAMEERLALVKESVDNAVDAIGKLDELTRYLECGVQAPKDAIDNGRKCLKESQAKIKEMALQYSLENDKSYYCDSQWLKVQAEVDKFIEENQTMFPGVKYDSAKPNFEGDPDLLLFHVMRYVDRLKAELSESSSAMNDRVNRAMETLPQGELTRKKRELEILTTYKKKRMDLDKDYKKRYDDQKAENERILRNSLKKQLDRSNDILATRLEQKEKETESKLDSLVEERVASEKKMMKQQLHEMTTKVKMVEDKLNAKLKAERETRRSQELWSAGSSLLAATKRGEPIVNVSKELKAIERASGCCTGVGDLLVLTVLKAIPESVKQKGLVPESVLREKYHVMERTALKVALVEQEGAALPIYFMSWLQSLLLFMKISGIPQEEIDKPPKEPSKDLDTFDLLQRARFWIERGNIALALRYVNSLEGASRGAAVVWSEAARAHLETRQAAEAVLAHAAALGLQYI